MRVALVLAIAACSGPSPAHPDAATGDDAAIDAAADAALDASVTFSPYEIRISEATIGANGHTRREVLVVGFAADGTPLTDDVIVSLDRASAGVLGADHLTLGPLGARTSFTPCDHAAVDCLGSARLSVAKASAPLVELAHVGVQLVEPTQVSTVAPCATGGNVFYLDGRDSLTYDMYRIDSATWLLDNSALNLFYLYGSPLDPAAGPTFTFALRTDYSTPTPFSVGTFTNLHEPTSQPGPSLDPNLNGGRCAQFTGAFQVHDVVLDMAHHVTAITATFEKQCMPAGNWLEGCFHYEP